MKQNLPHICKLKTTLNNIFNVLFARYWPCHLCIEEHIFIFISINDASYRVRISSKYYHKFHTPVSCNIHVLVLKAKCLHFQFCLINRSCAMCILDVKNMNLSKFNNTFFKGFSKWLFVCFWFIDGG